MSVATANKFALLNGVYPHRQTRVITSARHGTEKVHLLSKKALVITRLYLRQPGTHSNLPVFSLVSLGALDRHPHRM